MGVFEFVMAAVLICFTAGLLLAVIAGACTWGAR